MEEPEIALPPHTQRRVCRFVLSQMGQAIMTSHSPYVIEQFEPEEIVVLDRKDTGSLTSRKVTLGDIKAKRYRRERRQLAEAVLSRAVLVVEGATETAIFPAASELMENALGDKYVHFDLAGVSVFNAGGDNAVPKFGPYFNALGKMCFAFYDKPKNPLSEEEKQNLDYYTRAWESPENGIEKLLAKETPLDVLTRFLVILCHKMLAKTYKLCLCGVYGKYTLTQYRGQVSCVCRKAVHRIGSCRQGGTFSRVLHGAIVACGAKKCRTHGGTTCSGPGKRQTPIPASLCGPGILE
jgi:hypothetical protein